LVASPEVASHVDPRGLSVKAAWVSGALDLSYIAVRFQISLEKCHFEASINLIGAKAQSLSLADSTVGEVYADLISLEGDFDFSGKSIATGAVRLQDARVGGLLTCIGATFKNPQNYALLAQRLEAKGGVQLNDCNIEGTADFSGATVGGDLDCTNANLRNTTGVALIAENTNVKGHVLLRSGFAADGLVNLRGATIGGNLECMNARLRNTMGVALIAENVNVKGAVFLRTGFAADGMVELSGALIGENLELQGGKISNPGKDALVAERMVVGGSVSLRKPFVAEGAVNLLSATIGGGLYCEGATIRNPGKTALLADGIEVKGSIFFSRPFVAEGAVILTRAKVGGALDCEGASFKNKANTAIYANGLQVRGDLGFAESTTDGGLDLSGSRVDGTLYCDGATLRNPGKAALNAEQIHVIGNVFFRNKFSTEGTIDLMGATIEGMLDCSKAAMNNAGGIALSADRLDVKRGVSLDGCRANGMVRLLGANVGGNLECDGAALRNGDQIALNAEAITVQGEVFLRNDFMVEGTILLSGGSIGSSLYCEAASLNNPGQIAFAAERLDVKGDLSFMGTKVAGEIDLFAATIGGSLYCIKAEVRNPKKLAVNGMRMHTAGNMRFEDFVAEGTLQLADAVIGGNLSVAGELQIVSAPRAKLSGAFYWYSIANPGDALLDISYASMTSLNDEESSWPGQNNLYVEGLTYRNIEPRNVRSRLEWLVLQREFSTQPYRQLATFYAERGDDGSSREVLSEMERRQRLKEHPSGFAQTWDFLLKESVDYGYEPQRAIVPLLALSGLGWIIYRRAYIQKRMAPTERDAYRAFVGDAHQDLEQPPVDGYRRFNALIYSIENSIPLVKLGQADAWAPNPQMPPSLPAEKLSFLRHPAKVLGRKLNRITRSPQRLQWFLWIQIILGWILATLFVAGVTGIVRH
ncbi:MAG TPA: hypothetical protein VK743_01415, partial [Steroidobacteraceae bacterium]|nr:hypothetical protein [Steroidobacteraceae bacterium]